MASTQEIRRRIKSVKNTRQITKAMEMVAASKMKRAQESTLQSRAYSQEALNLLKNLAGCTKGEVIHPLLEERDTKKILAIVISSDKGMCGGYNSQIVRVAHVFAKENEDREIDWITIGKRGERAVKKLKGNIVATFNNFPTHPESQDIAPISRISLDGFSQKSYGRVVIIFTNFISTLKQTAVTQVLLPMSLLRATELLEEEVKDEKNDYEYTYEPDREKVLDYVLPRLSETQIFHSVLEAIASEQSARMMAMKSASDNANDLIDDLTLTYNSMRQASITQELAEVSAGSEAIQK
ncbi:MAG: ATP synthase F1 subunit gamma [bacterium]|nr:ATP synthase F1 subunit gamma [bacterium]